MTLHFHNARGFILLNVRFDRLRPSSRPTFQILSRFQSKVWRQSANQNGCCWFEYGRHPFPRAGEKSWGKNRERRHWSRAFGGVYYWKVGRWKWEDKVGDSTQQRRWYLVYIPALFGIANVRGWFKNAPPPRAITKIPKSAEACWKPAVWWILRQAASKCESAGLNCFAFGEELLEIWLQGLIGMQHLQDEFMLSFFQVHGYNYR